MYIFLYCFQELKYYAFHVLPCLQEVCECRTVVGWDDYHMTHSVKIYTLIFFIPRYYFLMLFNALLAAYIL